MKTPTASANDVDSYISGFPPKTQKLLRQMRRIIIKTVPEAEEVISYQIPAYKLHGMLVYFAGYTSHIGFYPGATPLQKFSTQLSGYKTSKGTVQFPADEPLPAELISKMTAYKLQLNLKKATAKSIVQKRKTVRNTTSV